MSEEVENDELPEIDESVEGGEAATAPVAGQGPAGRDLGLILEVPLRLSVEIGSATLPVREVLELNTGSVVELDRMNGEPADIYVNDRLIARGELEVGDERVSVRVIELISVENQNVGH